MRPNLAGSHLQLRRKLGWLAGTARTRAGTVPACTAGDLGLVAIIMQCNDDVCRYSWIEWLIRVIASVIRRVHVAVTLGECRSLSWIWPASRLMDGARPARLQALNGSSKHTIGASKKTRQILQVPSLRMMREQGASGESMV